MTIDKSAWGEGPWQDEADEESFIHAGLPCVISRGRSGALNGYVGVQSGHAVFGKDYDSIDVEVHGGLTYSDFSSEPPVNDAPEDMWWVGFDCAHCHDYSPGYYQFEGLDSQRLGTTYRPISYVRAETQRLAEQLSQIGVSSV